MTGPKQNSPVPLRNIVTLERTKVPTEVTHHNIQPTIELTMGVSGRDLGHVADDVSRSSRSSASPTATPPGSLRPVLQGEEDLDRLEDRAQRRVPEDAGARSSSLGSGLVLAVVLIYFLMVALFKSYVAPLVILLAVPIGLVGVVTVLFVTGTAINVQSLLGVIFMVGIVVSNTVLMVDFAQNLRTDEGLTPDQAIRKAAAIRVKPVVMTAICGLLRVVADGAGARAWQRGERSAGPRGHRRPAGRRWWRRSSWCRRSTRSWSASGRPKGRTLAKPAIGPTGLTRRGRLDRSGREFETPVVVDRDGPSADPAWTRAAIESFGGASSFWEGRHRGRGRDSRRSRRLSLRRRLPGRRRQNSFSS